MSPPNGRREARHHRHRLWWLCSILAPDASARLCVALHINLQAAATLKLVSVHENPPKSTPSRAHAWHRRILGTKQATTVIDCDSCACSLILMHLSNHASLCTSIHKPLQLSGWYRLMRIHQNRRHRETMRGTAESWARSKPPPSSIVIVALVP